jgi:hypothetical protein
MTKYDMAVYECGSVEELVSEANKMWLRMTREVVSYFDKGDWVELYNICGARNHDVLDEFFKRKIDEHGKRFLKERAK